MILLAVMNQVIFQLPLPDDICRLLITKKRHVEWEDVHNELSKYSFLTFEMYQLGQGYEELKCSTIYTGWVSNHILNQIQMVWKHKGVHQIRKYLKSNGIQLSRRYTKEDLITLLTTF